MLPSIPLRFLVLSALWLSAASASAAPPVAIAASHPLVGIWQFQLPDGSCVETYLIRSDGTTSVVSADERTESAFEITPKPDGQGFYAWTDRIVRTNGKQDCGGGTSKIGQQSTLYVRMSPDEDRMILCAERNLRTCIGPLVRMSGEKT